MSKHEANFEPMNSEVLIHMARRSATHMGGNPVCECEFVMWNGVVVCHNPASWSGVNLCCGEHGLYCDNCKSRADGNGDPRYILDVCADCGGRGITWTKLSPPLLTTLARARAADS